MLKQIYQQIQLTCDSLITVTIKSLFYTDPVYNLSLIHI